MCPQVTCTRLGDDVPLTTNKASTTGREPRDAPPPAPRLSDEIVGFIPALRVYGGPCARARWRPTISCRRR